MGSEIADVRTWATASSKNGDVSDEWSWDETLYAGSAAFYALGRMPYPDALAATLRREVRLDGSQRMLDVGCGPGSLALLLAPLVACVVGIDADQEMIDEAARAGRRAQIGNVMWRRMLAEELPADLGSFDLVTFAQSFHWMNRPQVAHTVRGMLAPNGVCVHVHATTHRGDASEDPLPLPRPPHAEIADLIARYLGPVRRAGRSSLPGGTPSGESDIFRGAGFVGPRHVEVAAGDVAVRSIDEVVAATYSLSSSTPRLFGSRRKEFERDLRELLTATADHGRFAERRRDIALDIWR